MEPRPIRNAIRAMGTRFEIVLDAEGLGERDARAAAEEALAIVEACDARWSKFRSDSLIARVNRDAFERPIRLDSETFELLEACARIRDASEGAFDVAVEPWMRARRFHEPRRGAAGGERGSFALDPAARTVRLTSRDAGLDLGAIAKGRALDLAAARLRQLGVERALLHGGTSSVAAVGAPPGEAAWKVAIEFGDRRVAVALRDCALGVSAPHGRVVERAGRALGHLLDPRTGEPVALGAACAVVARDACTADAWSTALLVAAARGVDLAPPDGATALVRGATGPYRLAGAEPERFAIHDPIPA
jgi:thiamine biosynthesis lipoprotein